MNVRFKDSSFGIVYKVREANIVDYDETLKKYCEGHRIELLGFVAKEMLEETELPANATDFAIEALNKKLL